MRSLLAMVACSLAGCVVQQAPNEFMCETSEDCDSGEVCDPGDHVCYGNPPDMPFAVVLTPPADRPDLVPRELVPFEPTTTDTVNAFHFEEGLAIGGRVVLADDPTLSVSAQIVFRRPARFPGGPDLVITTQSQPGLPDGMSSFEALLPKNEPGETYTVTIFPDDGNIYMPPPGEPTLAELVPPYRQEGFTFIDATDQLVFPLGGKNSEGGSKQITGRVVNASGVGVANLSVFALGRFNPLDQPEPASSRDLTDAQGRFTIVVAANWQDEFTLRLTSPAQTPLPDLELRRVKVDDPAPGAVSTKVLDDIALPTVPPFGVYQLPVFGVAMQGGLEPVIGATVIVRTLLVDEGDLTISYRTLGVVDIDGLATLQLIPGLAAQDRHYTLDVIPVPGSPHGQTWGLPLEIGPLPGAIGMGDAIGSRVLVSGTLVDHLGVPADGVVIHFEPSPSFVFDLKGTAGINLADAQWPDATTESDGRFSVWLDPSIMGRAATYTVTFEPPEGSLLPIWQIDDVAVLSDETNSLDLQELSLPDAAYARASIKDTEGGQAVPGATVDVYEVVDIGALCILFADTPDCKLRAPLRARARADESGGLRLVLPRP